MDMEFVRSAADRASARKEADRKEFEAECRVQRACDCENAAWNAWPDAWRRAELACDNESPKVSAIYHLAEAMDLLVQDIRASAAEAKLALALDRFDPSYCYGTGHEQAADAVRIIIMALQSVFSGSDSATIARNLLLLNPLPDMHRANTARKLIRVSDVWPLHCEGCDHVQPPETFDSAFCRECNLRGESIQLSFFADSSDRPMVSPPRLMQSINDLECEIEETVRMLDLWEPGMDIRGAAQSVIRFLSESAGKAPKVVRRMYVRPALQEALEQFGEGESASCTDSNLPTARVKKTPSTIPPAGPSDQRSIVLRVEKWSELAIGIHKDGSFRALPFVPDHGTRFPIEQAKRLDLAAGRWTSLLGLLAESEHGTTAMKKDLFDKFGYYKRIPRNEEIEDLRNDSEQLNEIKKVTTKLARSIGDLGRNLRKLVESADHVPRKCIPLSADDDRFVHAQFTTRHLVSDARCELRFGSN